MLMISERLRFQTGDRKVTRFFAHEGQDLLDRLKVGCYFKKKVDVESIFLRKGESKMKRMFVLALCLSIGML